MDVTREYIAPALAELRFAVPDESDEDVEVREAHRRAVEYAEEMVRAYTEYLEGFHLSLEEETGRGGPDEVPNVTPTGLVASEIAEVASEVRRLEIYLKRLVVFAHRFAIDAHSQSELSRLTGATRVTIARWLADDDLRREVTSVAAGRAAAVVEHNDGSAVADRHAASALGLLRWYSTRLANADS